MRHLDYMQIPHEIRFNNVRFGGGGSSGSVGYPPYLEDVHRLWLDAVGSDVLQVSVTEAMNTAMGGASPYAGLSAHDPAQQIADMNTPLTAFTLLDIPTLLTAYSGKITTSGVPNPTDIVVNTMSTTLVPNTMTSDAETIWGSAYDVAEAKADADVAADIVAFGALLDLDMTTNILPRFQRGMQDINAVYSSSFVIGEALIEARRLAELVKYGTTIGIQIKNSVFGSAGQMLQGILDTEKYNVESANLADRINLDSEKYNTEATNITKRINLDAELKASMADAQIQLQTDIAEAEFARNISGMHLEFFKAVTQLTGEIRRLQVCMYKEESDQNRMIDEADAKWDLEVFQYGANVMAAISGGTAPITGGKVNTALSTIGGGISGSIMGWNMGSAVGGDYYSAGIGAVIGGVIGNVQGYYSARSQNQTL